MAFAILKVRNARELANAFIDRGKPARRLAGGYIDDLARLGKCIWLCATCTRKFNATPYGYVIKMSLPTVRGNCDGCREFGLNTMFVPNEHRDGWKGFKDV